MHKACPEFGGCPLFGSKKCIVSTGIAVGTSAVLHYTVDVRYWSVRYRRFHCKCDRRVGEWEEITSGGSLFSPPSLVLKARAPFMPMPC